MLEGLAAVFGALIATCGDKLNSDTGKLYLELKELIKKNVKE